MSDSHDSIEEEEEEEKEEDEMSGSSVDPICSSDSEGIVSLPFPASNKIKASKRRSDGK
jgi:hypothetical protein